MYRSALFAILLVLLATSVSAQTYVSGYITSDVQWTQAGSPYILTGTLYVRSNASVVVQAGVEIQLSDHLIKVGDNFDSPGTFEATSAVIEGPGTLQINNDLGTSSLYNCEMIDAKLWLSSVPYFVAEHTDFTNCEVTSSSADAQFTSCNFYGIMPDAWFPYGIYVGQGETTLTSCTLTNADSGVRIDNDASIRLISSTLTSNGYPFQMAPGAAWYVENSDLTGNTVDKIGLAGSSPMDGPVSTWTLPPDIDGLTYELISALRIEDNMTMVVNNTDINMNGNYLDVGSSDPGGIETAGTTFIGSGYFDIGQYGDAQLDNCSFDDMTVYFNGAVDATGCSFSDVWFRRIDGGFGSVANVFGCTFTGSTVDANESSLDFRNCTFSDAEYGIEFGAGGEATILNCDFINLTYPIFMDLGAEFYLGGGDFVGNTNNVIQVVQDFGSLVSEYEFPTTSTGIPFQLSSDLFIGYDDAMLMSDIEVQLNDFNIILGDVNYGGALRAYGTTFVGPGDIVSTAGAGDGYLVECDLTDVRLDIDNKLAIVGSNLNGMCNVHIDAAANPFFKQVNFASSIGITSMYDDAHAEECWWGDAGGPTFFPDPIGDGVYIRGGMNIDNLLTAPYDETQTPAIVALIPAEQTFTVPADGRILGYDVLVLSNVSQSVSGNLWYEAVLPNGVVFPVANEALALGPRELLYLDENLRPIPMNAPQGVYTFRSKIGMYPHVTVDSESFEFSVNP